MKRLYLQSAVLALAGMASGAFLEPGHQLEWRGSVPKTTSRESDTFQLGRWESLQGVNGGGEHSH